MITVTCDRCGKKLGIIDKVELSLDGNDILSLGRSVGSLSTRKELCTTCAKKLLDWIENQEKVNDTKEI